LPIERTLNKSPSNPILLVIEEAWIVFLEFSIDYERWIEAEPVLLKVAVANISFMPQNGAQALELTRMSSIPDGMRLIFDPAGGQLPTKRRADWIFFA
jgi:hypothetical protein